VLKRDWHLFQILRAKSESRLPAVLSREEVRKILACVHTPRQLRLSGHGLRLRVTPDRGAAPGGRRCRQRPHDAARASGQGRQGPLRAVTQDHPCDPARTLRLSAFEFLHRFLQHVLPTGFMKVRSFGFLSASFAMSRKALQARVEMAQGFALRSTAVTSIEVRPPLCCRACGARLRYRRTILPLRVPPTGAHASIALRPAPG
jgi:hypothetical protein